MVMNNNNNNNNIDLNETKDIHKTWHKFYNWLMKTFGKDLYGKWIYYEFSDSNNKKVKRKYRHFDDLELRKRLVGYEVIEKIEKYVKRNCPEIIIVGCDDESYSSSILLLIPHPKHGITLMFVPQCTDVQNQIFLYDGHYKLLMKGLKNMKYVYKDQL